MRLAGLGIYSAEALSPVARFVSAWNFSCTGRDLTRYPEAQADKEPPIEDLATICQMLPGECVLPRVWLAEGRVPEEADPSWLTQKWWSSRVQEQQRETLAAKSTGRDVVRLQCLNNASAGTWLDAIPSAPLGLEISPAVFQVLLKFRLGEPLMDDKTPCPLLLFSML